MRKFIIFLAVVVVVSGLARAQGMGLSFGAGADLVTPAGDFSDEASTGWGLSAQLKFGLPIITVTGAVEYFAFGEKEFTGGTYSSNLWGINAGGRISLLHFIYVGAEIGMYEENSTTKNETSENKSSITRGSVAPIIGFEFLSFDLSARYIFMDKTDLTSIRLTYWF